MGEKIKIKCLDLYLGTTKYLLCRIDPKLTLASLKESSDKIKPDVEISSVSW